MNQQPQIAHLEGEEAVQPDILLAEQKDDLVFNSQLLEPVRDLLPASVWARNKARISTGLLFLYNLCCDLNGRTFGEEYANIVPVTRQGKMTLLATRISESVLRILGPMAFTQFVTTRVKWVKVLTEIVPQVALISFCLFGRYRRLSKWILGQRYIYSHNVLQERITFEILGLLLILKLLLGWKDFIRSNHVEAPAQENAGDEDKSKQCTLCLSQRQVPTCTPCGHVFCWQCILDWTVYDAKCPLCRRMLKPSRFIVLRNYS